MINYIDITIAFFNKGYFSGLFNINIYVPPYVYLLVCVHLIRPIRLPPAYDYSYISKTIAHKNMLPILYSFCIGINKFILVSHIVRY